MLEHFSLDKVAATNKQICAAEMPYQLVMTGEISEAVLDLFERAGLLLSGAREPDIAFGSAASDANERVSVELDSSQLAKRWRKCGTSVLGLA